MVVDELRPAEQVSETVKGRQLAAENLLSLVVGNGVRAAEVVNGGHHTQTWERDRNS